MTAADRPTASTSGTAPAAADSAHPAGQLALRVLGEADVATIARLEDAWFGGEAWSENGVRAELCDPQRCYLGLTAASGEIVGYGGISLFPEADLMTIAVAPASRGRGLGKYLLKQLLDAAEKAHVREVFLEVRATNAPAQALYRQLGFQELGVRKNYYRHPREDAITMKLKLGREQFPGIGAQ